MRDHPIPRFTALAQSLPPTVPFVGPETQERARGGAFAARIGANESGFGPSPAAIEAMARAASDVWMYGDPETHDLRHALAQAHGLPPDCLVVGEGIDGLLGLTVRLLAEPGAAVVTSAGAYPTFNYHVAGFGARLVTVPYSGDAEDPEALADAACETGARLVYLANPDNPMGSWHGPERIARLLDALPDGCLLCLDEAYIELAPAGTAPPWDMSDPRLIRFRTFSKAQGLAGLRVGWLATHPELAAGYHRIRNHFGVGRLAQAAALASLGDRAHLDRVIAAVSASRARIAEIAAANGLSALPSATNFVAIDCGRDGAYARAVLVGLIERGVFVRMPGVAPLDRCIRVSCGPEPDMAAFAEALPPALASAAA
ncbi:MAG: pyridoxal phosphate-dependent aminotransferase [Pseudomonadota bacterium]